MVLVLILVKLLKPARRSAREGRTGGGTPTSTTNIFRGRGGLAREDQGTTKGTFEDQLTRSKISTIES